MLRLILKPLQYFLNWILREIWLIFFRESTIWSFGVNSSTFSTFPGKLILFERLSPKFFLKNHAQDIFFLFSQYCDLYYEKKSSFWLKKTLITTSRALEIKKKNLTSFPTNFLKKKNSFQKIFVEFLFCKFFNEFGCILMRCGDLIHD